MNEKLAVLQENPVLSIFQKITEIPHPSEHEQKLAEWIIEFAKENGWLYEQDPVGNVIVRVPATDGLDKAESVCLQAHLDMVCVDAQGNVYGEEKFPLKLKVEGDWLSADGTTLGGDNGIGIALALAAASNLPHGPLELLFTVQEETGIIGATQIELAVNSKKLINLDSEDWKTVFIGCAGGCRCDIESDLQLQKTLFLTPWKITVEGLQGGHSGVDIHKNRGNAIIIMARIINELSEKYILNLGSLNGGSKDNVIPSSAESVLLSGADEIYFRDAFNNVAASLINEFSSTEPGLRIWLARVNNPSEAISVDYHDAKQIIKLILALPNGVLSMSKFLPDLVQTSNNIGIVNTDKDSGKISIALMLRSSSAADLELLKEKITDICDQFVKDSLGFKPKVIFRNEYPGWQPNKDSELLKITKSFWSANFSDKLEITSIHAGLECGILINKFPGLDAISLGPDIKGAHSAAEKVLISTVNLCFSFLGKLLDELAKN